jgi:nucleoside-diphosphate-sugar epimerase
VEEPLNSDRILITGSNGLIGSILWEKFSNQYNLYGIDNTLPGKHERTLNADLSDIDQTINVVSDVCPIDCILHLAANSSSSSGLKSVWKNNIIATKNIYITAKLFDIRRIVLASTNQVTFGYEKLIRLLSKLGIQHKISTRYPVWPVSYYGISKTICEIFARMNYHKGGIESICLRIGTVLIHDNPLHKVRHKSTWLSHKDLVQLFQKSITSKVEFGIYYGVSNNKDRFWEITNAAFELGYVPEDDASSFQQSSQTFLSEH